MWTHNGIPVTEPTDDVGFVYLITNKVTGRKYIGQKKFWFKVTKPPLKGRKNKRRSIKESDWRTYWGSSNSLKADIEALGEKNFTREILHFCYTKSALNYLEAREQFDRRVLETDEYYNGIISCKINKVSIY